MSALKHCLTPHERAVLAIIADGRTNKDIAQRMGIGQGGTRLAVHRIYRKLGVRSRRGAIWMYFTGDAFVASHRDAAERGRE